MIDANSAVAIARFTLLIITISIFLKVYSKLRFSGFITLAVGFAFSAVTLVLVETKTIFPSGPRYEALLIIVALMFLFSALLIYNSTREYFKNK